MYVKRFENCKKSARCRYNSLLNIWYNEIFIRLISIVILLTLNITVLIYSWVNSITIRESESSNVINTLIWFVVLTYTGVLIDIEASRGFKICFAIILTFNYMLIQNNSFIFSTTIDFLNFGVLWCAFIYKSSICETGEYYTDEFLLPLIDKDVRLLNAYNELWEKNEINSSRGYCGVFVTRYLLITFIFLCLFIMKAVDEYTNFDKYGFTIFKDFNNLLNLNVINYQPEFGKAFVNISKGDELAFIQLLLITIIVGLRWFFFNNLFGNVIRNLKGYFYINIEESPGNNGQKTKVNSNSDECSSDKGRMSDKGQVFFIIVFLFGLLTSGSEKYDIFSNIISMNNDIIILICIFLPIIGLVTEISVFRKWIFYFIFSLIIYNLNVLFQNNIIKVVFLVISGILLNVSTILYIYNNETNSNLTNKYPCTHYLIYKIIFFVGNVLGKYFRSSILLNDSHKIVLNTCTNIAIIGVLSSVFYNSNMTLENVCGKVERDVT